MAQPHLVRQRGIGAQPRLQPRRFHEAIEGAGVLSLSLLQGVRQLHRAVQAAGDGQPARPSVCVELGVAALCLLDRPARVSEVG